MNIGLRIPAFLKRKYAKFETIRHEIDALKSCLESNKAALHQGMQRHRPIPGAEF